MKATYGRIITAAFLAVGFTSLVSGQTSLDPLGPSQQSVLGPGQNPASQDVIAPQSTSTIDLGVSASSAPFALDTSSAPRIMINQTEVIFAGAQPGIIDGRLMVPVRDVAEQLGANVQWLNQEKQVVLNLPSQQLVTLDTNREWLGLTNSSDESRAERFDMPSPDTSQWMLGDTEIVLINDRAYMPFDQLAAAINGTGDWDRSAGMATITIDQPVPGPLPSDL